MHLLVETLDDLLISAAAEGSAVQSCGFSERFQGLTHCHIVAQPRTLLHTACSTQHQPPRFLSDGSEGVHFGEPVMAWSLKRLFGCLRTT